MDRYQPKSDFLKSVIVDDIPFVGEFGRKNLDRLIGFTQDADRSNRDWAMLLLSQTGLDTPQVLSALYRGATDSDFDVRCEAISGLAQRNVPEAKLFVEKLLSEETVGMMAVEAAGFVADADLLPILKELRSWWGVDPELLDGAIAACETGVKFER
jgi:HEAT repeat protein